MLMEDGGAFKRIGHSWRKLGYWGVPFKGTLGSLFPVCLYPAASSSITCSHYDVSFEFSCRLKAMELTGVVARSTRSTITPHHLP